MWHSSCYSYNKEMLIVKWRNDRIVITTNRTYLWWFVKQIFVEQKFTLPEHQTTLQSTTLELVPFIFCTTALQSTKLELVPFIFCVTALCNQLICDDLWNRYSVIPSHHGDEYCRRMMIFHVWLDTNCTTYEVSWVKIVTIVLFTSALTTIVSLKSNIITLLSCSHMS
jgi:hypothetical protein